MPSGEALCPRALGHKLGLTNGKKNKKLVQGNWVNLVLTTIVDR